MNKTDWPDRLTDWLEASQAKKIAFHLIFLYKMDKTDWLTDWPTDWLTDWLTDRLTDWPTDWLTDWLTDWFWEIIMGGFMGTDWLTDWFWGNHHGGVHGDWLLSTRLRTTGSLRKIFAINGQEYTKMYFAKTLTKFCILVKYFSFILMYNFDIGLFDFPFV